MEQVGVFTLIREGDPVPTDWHTACWWCGLDRQDRIQKFLARRARAASGFSDPHFDPVRLKHPGTLRACQNHFRDPIIRRTLELVSVAAALGVVEVA